MRVDLDTSLLNADAADFEQKLAEKVIGQDEAVIKATEFVQTFMARFHPPDRPIGIMLLLGPPVPARPGWSKPWPKRCSITRKHSSRSTAPSIRTRTRPTAPPGYIGYEKGDRPGLSVLSD